MKGEVIIALDFPNEKETLDFLDKFTNEKPFVKIGMELFYSEGPDIVRKIKAKGHKIFVDLKLHDIPNTVNKAMKSLAKLDVDMVNVHAAGTKKMMQAALEGLEEASTGKRPLIVAVTQLTSTDQQRMSDELLINAKLIDVVQKYAQNTKEAGLDGVVCSPLESPVIHKVCGEDFLTVTPGVRLANRDVGDQVRVTTPKKAGELGSSYIVVGRPITESDNPVEIYRRCMNEFGGQ